MPEVPAIFALTGGSFVILAFGVVMFLVLAYSYYTTTGSGIGKHPNDGLDGAPGSEGPSEASGHGRSPGTTSKDRSTGDTFSTHGTG